MPKPGDSAGPRHSLTLTRLKPALLEVRLTSVVGNSPATQRAGVVPEPLWSGAVEVIVQAAFAGRDLCYIAFEPPLEWSDLNLAQLSHPIKTMQRGNISCTLAFAKRVARSELAEVGSSQDFRHGGLLITTIPEQPGERITNFLDLLWQASKGFPAWNEWIHLPPDQIRAIFEEQIDAKLSSNEEFMECVDDGETIHWYHPQAEALSACVQEVQAVGVKHDWHVVVDQR